jgi:hypothetical protein
MPTRYLCRSSNKQGYDGHVTRTREEINAFGILTGQVLGKQPSGWQKGFRRITLRCILRF